MDREDFVIWGLIILAVGCYVWTKWPVKTSAPSGAGDHVCMEPIQCAEEHFAHGELMAREGQWEAAANAYTRCAAHNASLVGEKGRLLVARACMEGAAAWLELDDKKKALGLFAVCAALFQNDENPVFKPFLAKAFQGSLNILEKNNELEAAAIMCNGILRNFLSHPEPEFQNLVEWTLLKKSALCGKIGWDEQAAAADDAHFALFNGDADSETRDQAARRLFEKAMHFKEKKDYGEASIVLAACLARLENNPTPENRVVAAAALFEKGEAFGQLGLGEQAFKTLETCAARYQKDAIPACREKAAESLLRLAVVLRHQGKINEALAMHDMCFNRHKNDPVPAVRFHAVMAMMGKADIFYVEKNGSKTVATVDAALAHFQNEQDPEIRGMLAKMMCIKGMAQAGLMANRRGDNKKDALETYRACFDRFGNDTDREARLYSAQSLIRAADILIEKGDKAEARNVLEACVRHCGKGMQEKITTTEPVPVPPEDQAIMLVMGNAVARIGQLTGALKIPLPKPEPTWGW